MALNSWPTSSLLSNYRLCSHSPRSESDGKCGEVEKQVRLGIMSYNKQSPGIDKMDHREVASASVAPV